MRILIVRHAKAEDRDASDRHSASDAERPLTEAGRKQMRKAARALKELLPRIDVLASSPLVRARDTARLIAKEYKRLKITDVAALAPGASEKALLAWLQTQPSEATIALVGHEPDLSRLTSWLLAGGTRGFVEFKKGAACLLEFPETADAGRATLAWLLAPGQLRRLTR